MEKKNAKMGILWKIFSCLCYVIGNLIVRYFLTGGAAGRAFDDFPNMTPVQLAWLQNLVGCLIIVPRLIDKGVVTLKTAYPVLHLLRIIAAALGITLFYSTLKLMPIVGGVALLFTAPIFTVLLCCIFLKEKINLYRLTSIILALIGLLIISDPKGVWPLWNSELTWKIWLSFGAAISIVINKIIGKQLLLKGETAHLLTAYLVIGMAIVQLIPAVNHWVWPTFHQWFYILILGISTWIAHYALSKSYTYADVLFLVPFGFSRLLLSAFLSYVILGGKSPIKKFLVWSDYAVCLITYDYLKRGE